MERYKSIEDMQAMLTKGIFERQESLGKHNPYEQELRELESIEKGDEEAWEKSIAETYEGSIGVLASDPLRNQKNIAIGNITLASRAAIRGGLDPEQSFSMADSFINQVEEINDIEEVGTFNREAQRSYVRAVAELKNKGNGPKNLLVERAKTYIFSHLHDTIRISDVARELGVNPDYLSNLFSRTEGKTFKTYILEEKIRRSKNLLKYSDYSIQEISFYLGFSSQSHFSKVFAERENTTPGQYRKRYSSKESV